MRHVQEESIAVIHRYQDKKCARGGGRQAAEDEGRGREYWAITCVIVLVYALQVAKSALKLLLLPYDPVGPFKCDAPLPARSGYVALPSRYVCVSLTPRITHAC